VVSGVLKNIHGNHERARVFSQCLHSKKVNADAVDKRLLTILAGNPPAANLGAGPGGVGEGLSNAGKGAPGKGGGKKARLVAATSVEPEEPVPAPKRRRIIEL